MKNILILNEILEEVIANRDTPCVLFGVPLKISKEREDFLFHVEKDLKFDELNDGGVFTIPVFPYSDSSSSVRLLSKELNDKYEFLHTFGKREVHPQMVGYSGKDSQISIGDTLGFFDVERDKEGSRIKDRKSYRSVSEGLLEEGIPSWRDSVSPIIEELKESIREEYSLK